MDDSRATNYRRDRLPGLFRFHVAAASAFCRLRSAFSARCFSRSARFAWTTTYVQIAAMTMTTPAMSQTKVVIDSKDESLWVLVLMMFMVSFLANIVFHWVYVPLVNRIADWWLDREEAKAGKQ